MSSPSTRIWTKPSSSNEQQQGASPSSTAAVASSSSSVIHAVFDRMMESKYRSRQQQQQPQPSPCWNNVSPTSVVTIPLTPPPAVVQSRIIHCDNNTLTEQQGTEVTLLEQDARLYPRRCFADDDDDEDDDEGEDDINSIMTPLPVSPPLARKGSPQELSTTSQALSSPATPHKVPLCGIGSACWKQQSDALSPQKNHRSVEDCILELLGNNKNGILDSWQKHFFPRVQSQQREQEETTRLVQQRALLKRRPSQIKAQRKHLDDLRRNLHPFAASPKRVQLFRSTSTSTQVVQSARKAKLRTPLQELTSSNKVTKPLFWNPFACHRVVQENDVLEETFLVQGDGYDSDPECFGRTPCVRSSPARNTIDTPPRRLFALNVALDDEYSLCQAAASILNETWTLILHQPKQRPQAFTVFMERGQKLACKIVPPKLSWKPIPKKGRGRIIKKEPTVSLDILDIQRILALDEIDRQEYPLAKAGDSFLLKTINDCFCWQACSNMERDRLIASWKLTVARFGSFLVTGCDDGMEEYFVPVEAGVGFAGASF